MLNVEWHVGIMAILVIVWIIVLFMGKDMMRSQR